jgi:SH3-like domain-containing protein
MVLLAALAMAAPALQAQESSEAEGSPDAADSADTGRGSETNLPVPRYVSLKSSSGNVRRGPSLEHRIDWVFHHRDQPLRITAEFGHWRRVEDNEGQGGWIHYSLLSGVRTVLVTEPETKLHLSPDADSLVKAVAETGVIGELGPCRLDWCEITAGGQSGWVEKARIWGVDPEEIRD